MTTGGGTSGIVNRGGYRLITMVALNPACSWLDDVADDIRETVDDRGANHLYSVAALTDNSGNVVERYRYDAYGQRTVLAPDGTTTRSGSSYANQRGFTGYYEDKETGLYFARARMYSPRLGRFISRDFLRYNDGMSLYNGYFVPNALDPSGLWNFIIHNDILEHGIPADPAIPDLHQILQDASWDADFKDGAQDTEGSFKHYMSDGNSNQTSGEARRLAEQYIEGQTSKSIDLICSGKLKEGLYEFGLGLHTAMDAYSPQHTDNDLNPLPWDGQHGAGNALEALGHVIAETWAPLTRRGANRVKYAKVDVAERMRDLKEQVCKKCPDKAPPGWCKDTCPKRTLGEHEPR